MAARDRPESMKGSTFVRRVMREANSSCEDAGGPCPRPMNPSELVVLEQKATKVTKRRNKKQMNAGFTRTEGSCQPFLCDQPSSREPLRCLCFLLLEFRNPVHHSDSAGAHNVFRGGHALPAGRREERQNDLWCKGRAGRRRSQGPSLFQYRGQRHGDCLHLVMAVTSYRTVVSASKRDYC